MIKRKTKQRIDAKFTEMNINLENNYKDLAKTALKELDELIEQLYTGGELKDKDYTKLRSQVDDYKDRLCNYHH